MVENLRAFPGRHFVVYPLLFNGRLRRCPYFPLAPFEIMCMLFAEVKSKFIAFNKDYKGLTQIKMIFLFCKSCVNVNKKCRKCVKIKKVETNKNKNLIAGEYVKALKEINGLPQSDASSLRVCLWPLVPPGGAESNL